MDFTPNERGAVTLRDVVDAALAVLNDCVTVEEAIQSLEFVYGQQSRFTITADDLDLPILVDAKGLVQCGSKLVTDQPTDPDSFCLCLRFRDQQGENAEGDEFPIVRGLACVGRRSWSRLTTPTGWLDDELMNAFLSQVNGAGSSTYCAPSYVHPALLMRVMPVQKVRTLFFRRLSPERDVVDELLSHGGAIKTIAFTLHLNRNHWAMVAAVRRECPRHGVVIKLATYDSLRTKAPERRERPYVESESILACSRLVERFLRESGFSGTIENEVAECPQQNNGHDCGPIVLLMCATLALNVTLLPQGTPQGGGLRAAIGQAIRSADWQNFSTALSLAPAHP